MSLDPAEIARWQSWKGKVETRHERVEAESLRRYAAALGEPLDVEQRLPSLAHWACFLPAVPPEGLGPDGHPRRGGFLPPVSLPRRMFAAADMRFHAALVPGEPATRVSRIADVVHKSGRSGDLVLVEIEHEISQAASLCIAERQTIVYRDAGGRTPPIEPAELAPAPGDIEWQPGTVDLFRFSAVTFNSHRIHYDLPYATNEEGYPGLVVHGPFTAARLYGLAARRAAPARFRFRAQAPIFAGQPVLLRATAEGVLSAVRCDGEVAMSASVEY